ncbi:oxygen-independent coproporphyrinogen III oxidase [Aquabacter cavernae]|uniref:oxygen-independent coproporphyrinogen III oxidase n=1 Tax=Aquabacter cavernae TaxID=2496029 RepID=UPI000F8D5D86|nr:oxygen-independent coproporphyrinogen III oxidase [Aquabacter cavernae]
MISHVPPSAALLDHARRMVPRYTSYPTAPHFSAQVTGADYGAWLARLKDTAAPVSLYLHVPFCQSLCSYCGCNTKAVRREEPVRAYAQVLAAEIALVAEQVGTTEVSHIHWGGGTPNALPPDCLEELAAALHRHFRIPAGIEHAIELDPRHLTQEGARLLAGIGITRASLGVQTLDGDVQTAIGRIQPLETVAAGFAALRAAGIAAINADLMYGLPRQTHLSIADTVRHMLDLRPNRISLFGYAHVPWMKSHQKLVVEADLPGAEARIRHAGLAREMLVAGGYVEIGIDHFALPDDSMTLARDARRLHRNFQGYTTDEAGTLLGLGASSISRTPFGYAQNAPDVAGWRRAVDAGCLPTVKGRAFAGEDALRGDVIAQLLCYFDVDLAEIAASHGAPPEALTADLDALRPFLDAGWVTFDGKRLAITSHAHEIARVVASAFDAYLGQGGRHSMAV